MKSCLKKIMGKALLTFEELRTVVYEIECTLNSRPLTYVDAWISPWWMKILIIIF